MRTYFTSFLICILAALNAACKEEGKEIEKMTQAETICLLPVGEVNEDVLFFLQSELQKVFQRQVKIAEGLEHPDYAYNPEREQYLSPDIVDRIKKEKSKDCDRILGVVDIDLYVPSLNFVFGQADFHDRVAVISLTRLRQEYYGLSSDEKLFRERALKEAVHELGHTYGLRHCPDTKCVMHFSNSLKDTDIKSHNFCPGCKSKLSQK
jgi:archaemetzincin